MSAAYTHKLSVQVSDFESISPLIQLARLICDFCSSNQRFACGFLQIPPRDGHPCRPANDSPCRVRRRLSLPSECALPGALREKAERALRLFVLLGVRGQACDLAILKSLLLIMRPDVGGAFSHFSIRSHRKLCEDRKIAGL